MPALHNAHFTGTKYVLYGTSNAKVSSYVGPSTYARNPGDIDEIAFGVFIINVEGHRYHVVL